MSLNELKEKQEIFLTRDEMKKFKELKSKIDNANTRIEVKIYHKQIMQLITKAQNRQASQPNKKNKNNHAYA